MITMSEYPVNNELERKLGRKYLLMHLFPRGRKAVIPVSLCLQNAYIDQKPTRMKINTQVQPFTAFFNTKESHKDNKSLGNNP